MHKHAACWAALTLVCHPPAQAGPAIYVLSPIVEYGEREVELVVGTQRGGGQEREDAARMIIGMGVLPRWWTEVGFEMTRRADSGTQLEAVEWENIFQLTERGEYPVDLGLVFEVERLQDRDEGYELKYGPLMQTDVGRFQLNLNLLFERHVDAKDNGDTEMGYQWQVKYRWKKEFEVGAQGYGEMGKWNDWETRDAQQHLLGPAVFGKLPVGDHRAIKYNAAYLFGVTDGAPDHTIRAQFDYEF